MCRTSTRGGSWLHFSRGLVAGLVLASMALALSASARAEASTQPIPASFYGLNAQALFRLPPAEWDAQLTKLAATGVGTVRFDSGWAGVESKPPSQGVHAYNWTRLDQIMAALARHNLQGLPIVDYSTKWDSSNPTGSRPETYPPADPAPFAEYARALAARYGPKGEFWTANPSLPVVPVYRYEIWNEENSDYFFRGADPTVYAPLYADARAAIHSVVPSATVLVGGLVPGANAVGWLQGFIAALPEHGQEIDAIGWHPYNTTSSAVYAGLSALHSALSADSLNPPIELTEVNSPVTEGQATLLNELARTLPASNCHVTSMIVHTWTALPEDGPYPFAIADSSGNLNASGLAFSSAVQTAETEGLPVASSICTDVPPASETSNAAASSASSSKQPRRASSPISSNRQRFQRFRHGQTLRLRRQRPRRVGLVALSSRRVGL
jgi:hypothetical protein